MHDRRSTVPSPAIPLTRDSRFFHRLAMSRRAGDAERDGQISKHLSCVLRHTAEARGLNIQRDGYVAVREVLQLSRLRALNCTVEDLARVVHESDKQRFEFRSIREGGGVENPLEIRARQGHSMTVVEDSLALRRVLSPEDLPSLCVHGTFRRHLLGILELGLLAGGARGQGYRSHVHFCPAVSSAAASGMRYGCELEISVNLRLAVEDGVPVYVSTNQAIQILCKKLPPPPFLLPPIP